MRSDLKELNHLADRPNARAPLGPVPAARLVRTLRRGDCTPSDTRVTPAKRRVLRSSTVTLAPTVTSAALSTDGVEQTDELVARELRRVPPPKKTVAAGQARCRRRG